MKSKSTTKHSGLRAFTLVEVAISTAIAIVVVIGTLNVFISFLRSYNATTLMRNTSTRTSLALERIVYGSGTNDGLREAMTNIVTSYSSGGWTLSYWNSDGTSLKSFQYTTNTLSIKDGTGKSICTNVISSMMTNYVTGCKIWVTVAESAGGRTYTSSVSTFVQYRN